MITSLHIIIVFHTPKLFGNNNRCYTYVSLRSTSSYRIISSNIWIISITSLIYLQGNCPFNEDCHYAHGELELNRYPGAEDLDDSEIIDNTRNNMSHPLALPFPVTAKVAYFLCHSPDLRSLLVSKRRHVWATNMHLTADMNIAYRTSEYVILFFVVKNLKGKNRLLSVATSTAPTADVLILVIYCLYVYFICIIFIIFLYFNMSLRFYLSIYLYL